MVSSAPNVLTISIEGSMAPKLDWLSRRLMLSNEELAAVVTTCPQVSSAMSSRMRKDCFKWDVLCSQRICFRSPLGLVAWLRGFIG